MKKTTTKELHKERVKMWNASIDNHKKYIDSNTGIFLEKFVENRPCPVCASNSEIAMFYKEGGKYVKCGKCEMVYINPVFKDSALKDYYQQNHACQSDIVEKNIDEFYTKIYNTGLDAILNGSNDTHSILDIGCSSGVFLDIAKTRNIKTYGIELNKIEYEYSKKKGHHVYNDILENISFDTKFDAVSLWDVFEHLKNGEFYLNTIKNILSSKGKIFLQIPSSDSLAAKILQKQCNMFDGLEHVNLYGVKTITQLADKCGLKIFRMKTIISEIGVINNYLNYENPYFGNATNTTSVINLIDEKEIHENLMGYKLQIVLGKK